MRSEWTFSTHLKRKGCRARTDDAQEYRTFDVTH